METIAEAWEIVSRLLSGDRSGFEGEIFRLGPGVGLAFPASATGCRCWSARWSPRLTSFAAGQAAELKLGGSANPSMVRLARERLGAAEVGIVAGAVTVVDTDDARAREHARRRVAMYLEVVAGLDPTAGVDPDLIAAVARASSPPAMWPARRPHLRRRARSVRVLGNARPDRSQALALYDAGARRVEFGTPHGLDERRASSCSPPRFCPGSSFRRLTSRRMEAMMRNRGQAEVESCVSEGS